MSVNLRNIFSIFFICRLKFRRSKPILRGTNLNARRGKPKLFLIVVYARRSKSIFRHANMNARRGKPKLFDDVRKLPTEKILSGKVSEVSDRANPNCLTSSELPTKRTRSEGDFRRSPTRQTKTVWVRRNFRR